MPWVGSAEAATALGPLSSPQAADPHLGDSWRPVAVAHVVGWPPGQAIPTLVSISTRLTARSRRRRRRAEAASEEPSTG